jgi:hypothetical protein
MFPMEHYGLWIANRRVPDTPDACRPILARSPELTSLPQTAVGVWPAGSMGERERNRLNGQSQPKRRRRVEPAEVRKVLAVLNPAPRDALLIRLGSLSRRQGDPKRKGRPMAEHDLRNALHRIAVHLWFQSHHRSLTGPERTIYLVAQRALQPQTTEASLLSFLGRKPNPYAR